MTTCYILIGLPASGKSTWLDENINRDPFNHWTISTDDIVMDVATLLDMSYDDVFSSVVGLAEKVMWREVQEATDGKGTIFVDRTNLTARSRKKFIDFLKPHGYTFKAIVFPAPDEIEWQRRLDSRKGKTIPGHVLKSMQQSYEMPLMSEGFDEIITIYPLPFYEKALY
jgi:predicted kinase